ncbi:hypothetical protein [Streptomyces lasalocidi]|uniref:Helix-turn-helix domain-containing protein n=1 Tax=Streptomyces lasalocidi TaxID=324833 RepID=A0A4U5WMK6_STRLS|nr:hypothetical protein [Streptomyces lasalocidi]TKT03425.1 hypothetical protein E4U91_27245 [Streptomyces lasalocidi]
MNTTPEGPFEFQAAVWVSDLTPQERVVALAYGSSYNWKNQDDSKCGIYRIAAMTGIGKSQVSKYRSSLTEKGWLETTRRFGTSSLTKPTIPAGFSYEDEKGKQDELVQSQNDAEKERRKKATKKDDEIAALKAQLAALQAQKTPAVQEDPQPVAEPQEAVQGSEEMSKEEAQKWLDLDPFEDEEPAKQVVESGPVAEEKVEAPKKTRRTKKAVEKIDPVKQMLEQARAKRSFEDDFVASRIAESDNPVEAQRLYDSEEFEAKYPDKVQRAAQAAFEVMGSLATA